MKKLSFTIIAMLLLSGTAATQAQLRHIEGFNAVGLKVGTGFGNTFTAGVSHNYYWGKHWSVDTNLDFETGHFGKSRYFGLLLSPGIEASVWQPLSWMYIHLNGHLNVGYDRWYDNELSLSDGSFALGCDLGFNVEMYVSKSVSLLVGTREHFIWNATPVGSNKSYYFKPLFFAAARYNF